jgi:hypothetical protein
MANATTIIPFSGGEDLTTAPLSVAPGRCIFSLNYEVNLNGGYSRIAGYLKYDGSESPAVPPGEGAILGGFTFDGDQYTFRNDVGGAAASLYKSSASGWTKVAGVSLNPGGRFETIEENFLGTVGTKKVYWVDGKNPAYEFDGTAATPINSGATVDTPTHIEVHKSRLWLGFETGELRYSPVGVPGGVWADSWTQGVIGIGRPITGLLSLTGDAIGVFSESRTHILYGSSSSDFNLTTHSKGIGGKAYTVQRITDAIFLDDQGVTTLQASQIYGDFSTSSISESVTPYIHSRTPIASVGVRKKSQYRLFYDTGEFSIATFAGNKLKGWTRARYDFTPSCVWRGEVDGIERLFAGATNGCVYELDVGTSFDGDEFLSVLQLPYWSLGKPYQYKSIRKTVLEFENAGSFTLSVKAVFDYSGANIPKDGPYNEEIPGTGFRWSDSQTWGSGAVWGGAYENVAEIYTTGTCRTMSLILSMRSNIAPSFTLKGAAVVAELRRAIR